MGDISPTGWTKGRLLGRGSFGCVYEGISAHGFCFAVKEVPLLDHGRRERNCVQQLQQAGDKLVDSVVEISLLSTFQHPNIVQYHGSYEDESNLHMFLELVPEGSLRKLYQTKHLSRARVSIYTEEILLGLKYIHDRNVVHRDIKCANILVDSYGHVKLADFGLAKITELNEIQSLQGSAFWMAPEVVTASTRSQGYGLPADIWSLGCTVLEMLTRRLPYNNLEWSQALFRLWKEIPPEVPNSLPDEAKHFIRQCLQVDPNDRPTAAQLLDHPFLEMHLWHWKMRPPRGAIMEQTVFA